VAKDALERSKRAGRRKQQQPALRSSARARLARRPSWVVAQAHPAQWSVYTAPFRNRCRIFPYYFSFFRSSSGSLLLLLISSITGGVGTDFTKGSEEPRKRVTRFQERDRRKDLMALLHYCANFVLCRLYKTRSYKKRRRRRINWSFQFSFHRAHQQRVALPQFGRGRNIGSSFFFFLIYTYLKVYWSHYNKNRTPWSRRENRFLP